MGIYIMFIGVILVGVFFLIMGIRGCVRNHRNPEIEKIVGYFGIMEPFFLSMCGLGVIVFGFAEIFHVGI